MRWSICHAMSGRVLYSTDPESSLTLLSSRRTPLRRGLLARRRGKVGLESTSSAAEEDPATPAEPLLPSQLLPGQTMPSLAEAEAGDVEKGTDVMEARVGQGEDTPAEARREPSAAIRESGEIRQEPSSSSAGAVNDSPRNRISPSVDLRRQVAASSVIDGPSLTVKPPSPRKASSSFKMPGPPRGGERGGSFSMKGRRASQA